MTLPKLLYKPEKLNSFHGIKEVYDDTDELCKMITTYIQADNWALTVNDQILYDNYKEHNIREYIINKQIRAVSC